MKKSILLLCCLICLTGCTKKVTCVKESKTGEYTINLKSIYSYKKDNLIEVYKSSTIEFKSEKDAKEYYNQYKETAEFNKEYGSKDEIDMIEKNKVSQTGKTFKIEAVYTTEEIKKEAKTNEELSLSKEDYIKTFEKNGYECK